MQLKDLVEKEKGSVSGWATFMEGFDVELQFVERKTLQEMRRKCTRTIWRSHQPVEELDEERFYKMLAGHILGWRGLNEDVLRKLFPLPDGFSLDGLEVPCDDANKSYMLQDAYGFDDFVFKHLTDLETLKQEQFDSEAKNSEALSQES